MYAVGLLLDSMEIEDCHIWQSIRTAIVCAIWVQRKQAYQMINLGVAISKEVSQGYQQLFHLCICRYRHFIRGDPGKYKIVLALIVKTQAV